MSNQELYDLYHQNVTQYETKKETDMKEINAKQRVERCELLTILMEECAELTVEASKLIRFGSDVDFGKVHKMEVEAGDVMCMINLLSDYGIVDLSVVKEHAIAKRIKLKTWSELTKL